MIPTPSPSETPPFDGPDALRPICERDHSSNPSFIESCTGSVLAAILRKLSASWRVECEGLETLDRLVESQRRHILCFWHRDYVTLFRLFHDRSTVAITNQTHRGHVIAEICRRSGMKTLQVHGKGTKQMLQTMEGAVREGFGLAIAVDGPLGPAREVKRATLRLAARLECSIMPVSVASTKKIVLKQRWDRLEIPHLLSRVAFFVGVPLEVPLASSREELSEVAQQLRTALEHGEERAQRKLGAHV